MALLPITINGNTLDPQDVAPSSTAFSVASFSLAPSRIAQSDYITLQSAAPLAEWQKDELSALKVQIQEYVSKNTYLCQYQPEVLDDIKAKSYILHVAEYDTRFKTASSLKISLQNTPEKAQQQDKLRLQIQLHRGLDKENSVKAQIAQTLGVPESHVKFQGNILIVEAEPNHLANIESVDGVKCIHEEVPMVVYNNIARGIIGADFDFGNVGYTGKGQIVAVADTGFDTGDPDNCHPAFAGRVKKLIAIGRTNPAKTDDPKGHGTHVCGSVLGNGNSDTMGGVSIPSKAEAGKIQGSAPDAQLIMQSLLKENGKLDTSNLLNLFETARDSGALIHSNSWGPDWKIVHKQLDYGTNGRVVDNFVFHNPTFLVLNAAGNDGDRRLSGFPSQIGSSAAAKNCITVGATDSSRPNDQYVFSATQIQGNDAFAVASFSSRGPTKEGRIKPDVMAPGTAILSAKSQRAKTSVAYGESSDPAWTFNSGTSMATPLVAGCAAVIREALAATNLSKSPSAALLKAILINGAVDLHGIRGGEEVGPAPNVVQGFGRVNLQRSMIVPGSSAVSGFVDEDETKLCQGDVSVPIVLSVPRTPAGQKAPTLLATLAYTDEAGEMLQVDLNLYVVASNGIQRNGNMSTASDKWDEDNNVEKVVWPDIPPGECKIYVRCTRTTKPAFEQRYVLVWNLSTET